jgi:glutamyl/glutaminyl-tRNA synthetase
LDAIQGITHAMRSIEYKDRDSQYEWFLEKLKLKNGLYPIISDYGKLNFSHTVLSKRKLGKLIAVGLVDNWMDPRMPTIRGIIRKGIQIEPLLEYIKTQITSRTIVLLTWDKLWSFNLAYLDKSACRLYGLSNNTIEVKLTGDLPEFVNLLNHPKNLSMGTRKIDLCQSILADQQDFINVKLGDRYTLVGLGNTIVTNIAPPILNYDKTDNDYKSTIKITWLPNNNNNIKVSVRSFGYLLSKPKLEEGDDILKYFNLNSINETEWLIEQSILSHPQGSIFQIMRKDFCYVDKSDGDNIILNIVPTKK